MSYDSRQDTLAHIERVRELLKSVEARLASRGFVHDASKLQEPEKSKFDEATPKLRNLTYGSEEYKESLRELGVALGHHYAYNRHHPEHFCLGKTTNDNDETEYTVDKESLSTGQGISSMNLLDLIEMLMDWKAATERHDDGDIIRSIRQNQERFGYDDQLLSIFLNTADEFNW